MIKIIYSNLLIFDRRDNSGSENHSTTERQTQTEEAHDEYIENWTQLFLFSCVQCFLLLLFRYLENAVRFHSIINYADTSVNGAMMQQGYWHISVLVKRIQTFLRKGAQPHMPFKNLKYHGKYCIHFSVHYSDVTIIHIIKCSPQ